MKQPLNQYHSEIMSGLRSAFPIFLGYFFVSIAFGILVRSTGLSVMEGQSFSLFVFAGAAQFAALSMIRDGVPALVLIAAVFFMNLRHFLMSASLSRTTQALSPWVRPLLAFGVTDETFAVASMEARKRGKPLSAPYLLSLNSFSWLGWNLGTLTGFMAGFALPSSLQTSMTMGLYLLFVALLVPQVKKNFRGLLLAISAGVLHSLINLAFPFMKNVSLLISLLGVCLIAAFIPEPALQEKAS